MRTLLQNAATSASRACAPSHENVQPRLRMSFSPSASAPLPDTCIRPSTSMCEIWSTTPFAVPSNTCLDPGTLTVPSVILTESFISFLGLGVQEPSTSWGVLISEGARIMETNWWALVFPGAFLAVTLFCFNFIGDGLRDALDPRDR